MFTIICRMGLAVLNIELHLVLQISLLQRGKVFVYWIEDPLCLQTQLFSIRHYGQLLINYKTACSFDCDTYIQVITSFLCLAPKRFCTSHTAYSTQEFLIRTQLNVDGLHSWSSSSAKKLLQKKKKLGCIQDFFLREELLRIPHFVYAVIYL